MRKTNRTVKRLLLLAACLAAVIVNAGPASRVCAAAGEGDGAAPAQSEDKLRPVKIWEQDGVEALAIQDRPGQMDVALFSGPAAPAERAGYFKDGKTEAGVNAFLLRAHGRNILVDTGFGRAAPGESRLMEQLAWLGLAPEDLDAVLLSHMHTDHIGGLVNDGLRVFPKAKLLVSAVELDYWQGGQEQAQKGGKAAVPSPNVTLARQVIAAYGEDVRKFYGGPLNDALELESISIMALPAFGHTPGHTVFSLGAGEPRLLILGDLVHAVDLQFAIPQECAAYDQDQRAAVFVRESVLSLAAETHAMVAGMHIPFPGAGYALKEGKGFRFVPLE
ncbi:MAG: MBL fold metallo-hydrolase [Deltaproteobacteria bacterium]|nr:MBL fold metallo-hydrolase [Deltaproteobacteria bacterium]